MEGLSRYERNIRPWGEFERFTLNEHTTVKILTIKPRESVSLQTHAHRSEFWRILTGSGIVTIGDQQHKASPPNDFFIPVGEKHRIEAGLEGISWLEIAFGEFDEADITRLEDNYGRT